MLVSSRVLPWSQPGSGNDSESAPYWRRLTAIRDFVVCGSAAARWRSLSA